MKWMALVILLVLFSTVASAVPCTINLNPSEKNADNGDLFAVVLYVTVVGEADTVAVDLITWDADVLECTNIVKGDLFSDVIIWLRGTIQDGSVTGSVMASNIPISDKSGIYSTLSFRVKNAGDTTITLHDFGVARAGEPLDVNILGGCHVIVLSSSPPVTPPIIPPVQPPQNQTQNNDTTNTTNNTIPPVNETNETIPPIIPPVTPPPNNSQNDTNSSKYQPISNKVKITDNANWLPYYVVLSSIFIVFIGAMGVLKARIKKQKEKEEKEGDAFGEKEDKEDIFN